MRQRHVTKKSANLQFIAFGREPSTISLKRRSNALRSSVGSGGSPGEDAIRCNNNYQGQIYGPRVTYSSAPGRVEEKRNTFYLIKNCLMSA